MTSDAPLVRLDALNPSQNRILSLAKDSSLIVWSGAVRSGKGVGTAVWLASLALARFAETARPANFICAGATVGSFLANNEEYIHDICAQAGVESRFATQPTHRIVLALNGARIASLRVYGGGNARSHFSLRGLTAHSAWIDEATLCHENFVRTAIQRCSFADSRVVLTTNAGTPTHYIKRDYIDTRSAILLETDFHENIHYSAERRSEMLALNPHTADYARAIQNRWAADEGAIIPILPEHCDDATYEPSSLKGGEVYLDPGTAGTTAALLLVPTAYGWLVADEYYHDGARVGRLTDEEHLRRISARWAVRRLTIDPAAASMRAQATRMGMFNAMAKNEFEAGVQSANNALHAGRVRIRSSCRNLLSESGGYIWNAGGTAPIVGAPDHLMDCLRYACHDKYPTSFSAVF